MFQNDPSGIDFTIPTTSTTTPVTVTTNEISTTCQSKRRVHSILHTVY